MSSFELNKWKQKVTELNQKLAQKDQIIEQYKGAIEQSNQSIQEIMDKLSLELKLANQMHRILLPTKLPVIPDCEFSFKFRSGDTECPGKDFYEIVPHLHTKSFCITLSSCVSHTWSSLLFSARLKTMSLSKAKEACQPHEFIAQLSKEIQKDTQNSFFSKLSVNQKLSKNIDLFYAVLDQHTYQLSYSLLGNIKVFIQRTYPNNIIEELLETSDRKPLSSKSIALNSKDRIIVCSPGIFSVTDPSGEKFSTAFLKKIICKKKTASVHELRNHILYELDKFCQAKPPSRDQSMVVIHIKSAILKLT